MQNMVYVSEATAKYMGSKDGVDYYKDDKGQWYTRTKTYTKARNVTPDTVAKKTSYSRDKDGNWVKTVHTYRKVSESVFEEELCDVLDHAYYEGYNQALADYTF